MTNIRVHLGQSITDVEKVHLQKKLKPENTNGIHNRIFKSVLAEI